MLPDSNEWGSTILTVVQQNQHSIWVHGLTGVELPVVEGTNNLLDVLLSTLLKDLNLVWVGLLQLSLDGLHVTLDVSQKGLLVKGCLLQTEGVDNVVDGLLGGVQFLVTTFSRWVGTDINVTVTNGNHLTVGLVDDIVNQLDVVGIRQKLVVRDDILAHNVSFNQLGGKHRTIAKTHLVNQHFSLFKYVESCPCVVG